ncbi:MAG: ABC transporter ATP-binding protein/permease [Bacteroidales bacterium]|nr:ABC transporter ATP-binding protein/permease [Bacteroidales bacterium]
MPKPRHILRVYKYLRFFKKEIVLNLLFNLLHIFFNLFSFVLIIPFIELLFGLTVVPDECPELGFDQHSLTAWATWQLYRLRDLYGLWRCLLAVVVAYMSCSFLSNLFRYMAMRFQSPIRNGIIERLRNDIYHRITILPVSYFTAGRRGDIMSRMSNDLADVEWSVVCSLDAFIKSPINIVVFCATLIFVSPKLFGLFLLILPVTIFFMGRIGRSLKKNSVRGQQRLGGLFAHLEETLDGIRTVKAYAREKEQTAAFNERNRRYTRSMLNVASRRELSSPLSEVLGTVALVPILIVGGLLVTGGEMQSSVFIFFVIIFIRLIPPVQTIVRAYSNIQKGSASAARLFEIIDADEEIVEQPGATVLNGFNTAIEYRDVSFSYRSSEGALVPVLNHVNLRIDKGRMVAIVGPSGAGKTTLADLMPRFYDCTEGDILIDGLPIRQANINSLRALMGIVSQSCVLFNDTVANNIAFGLEGCSPEQVRLAARVAFADGFIEALPDGYDTVVGDRGVTLSGGQRQRISIARAVLRNPPILILDEATSALDAESEREVQQALEGLMKGRTAVVIAHRLSTIRQADEILVLEKGEIVERGTHSELAEADGLYRKLLDMQTFA